jgi:poly(A) polymerase
VPKRFTLQMHEIWSLQHRFDIRRGKRPFRLISHPRFRAAYDFLLLRAEAGEVDATVADWWTRFQLADAAEREQMAQEDPDRSRRPKRRRGRAKASAVAE